MVQDSNINPKSAWSWRPDSISFTYVALSFDLFLDSTEFQAIYHCFLYTNQQPQHQAWNTPPPPPQHTPEVN